MVPKKCLLLVFIIMHIHDNGSTSGSNDLHNYWKQIFEHVLPISNSDTKLGYNPIPPPAFQGTIILNVNYPESKAAINIYNSPNQRSNICSCNHDITSKHMECKCDAKHNSHTNVIDTIKNENNKQEYVVQADDIVETNSPEDKNNEVIDVTTVSLKNSNSNLNSEFMNKNIIDDINGMYKKKIPMDNDNFDIQVKGNHDHTNNTDNKPITTDNVSENNTFHYNSMKLLSQGLIKTMTTNLLNMLDSKVAKIEEIGIYDKIKVTKKIDRLRDLTRTNSTTGYLNPHFMKKHSIAKNSTSSMETENYFNSVPFKETIFQESINNFQQYLPPLEKSSDFKQNAPEMSSVLNLLCPLPRKCVYLMYCTPDAKISNIPVILLNKEEEEKRNKLLDCTDKLTGRTGKCCLDAISGV